MSQRDAQREILYEQEVMGFLQDFVYPQVLAGHHNPPQNIAEIMADTQGIWATLEGFATPLELRKALLRQYLEDENEDDIIALVDTMGRMRYNERDPMTGYMRKSELGIMTGLAHLYAKMTDEPCAIIEIDFSNMGGTNDFFQDLMARAEGVPFEEIDPQRAFALTDNAVRIAAQIITEEVRHSQGPNSVLLPIRAGGDELRVIGTNVDPAQFPEIRARIHNRIEMEMARLGLMDHPHKKHPDNPIKNGFGAAIAIHDLRHVRPATYMEQADAAIDAAKTILGHYRAGVMPPLQWLVSHSTTQAVRDGFADGENLQERLTPSVQMQHQIYRQAMALAGTGPETQDAAIRLENIRQAINRELWACGYEEYESCAAETFLKSDQNFFEHAGGNARSGLLYMSVAEDYEWKLVHMLKESDLEIDDYEMEALHATLMGLTATDPATDVPMPRDLPRQLEIYMRDVAIHIPLLIERLCAEQKLTKAASSPIRKALQDADLTPQDLEQLTPMMMGVAFHNLAGLNKVFGHDNANKALHYMAQDVLKETLLQAGLREDDYAIAHEGGGNFTLFFKPVIEDKNGFITIPGPALMRRITNDLQAHMQLVNDEPVTGFMAQRGMVLQDEDAPSKAGMRTMADLPDQKQRPWANGLKLSTVARRLDKDAWDAGQRRTGFHLYQLRQDLDAQVEADRALYKQLYITNVQRKPKANEIKPA